MSAEEVSASEMKLIIATPFYEVKAYSPYIVSLCNTIRVLHELGVEWDYWELSGDSYVDRAKNSLVHRFMEQTDYTHIMIVDSDLAWNYEGFIRLFKAATMGAEVVGAAYPNKNNWSTFGAIPILKDGKPLVKEVGGLNLVQMWGIPGGFLIYSRKAFDRAAPNLNIYIDPNIETTFVEYFKCHIQDFPFTGDYDNYTTHLKLSFAQALVDYGEFLGDKKNDKFMECFRCNVEKNAGRIGEDIYFQQRYREMGGTIWCEPNVDFLHIGVKAWEGNYSRFLKNEYFPETPQPQSPIEPPESAYVEHSNKPW